MVLHTLRLKNYKQYTHLDLEFREGLVGIIGRNGAGKSTLFEAILYCLFGREDGAKSYVRTAFADPKETVSLELSFSIGAALYEVRREFRGKSLAAGAEFYKNDALIAKGSTAVNEEIGRIIHIEYDAFKRSVFSGQRELAELSDATGEARKKMVRRMLGLDTLDEVQTAVNTDIKDFNARIAGQSQNLLSAEEIEAITLEINALEALIAETRTAAKAAAEHLEASSAQYRAARQAFDVEDEKQKRHELLQRQSAEWQGRLGSLESQAKTLAEKQHNLQALQAQLELRKGEFDGYHADKKQWSELDQIRQRKLNHDTYAHNLRNLQPALLELEKSLAQLKAETAQREQTAENLAQKTAERAALSKEIEAKRFEYQRITNEISATNARIGERLEKVKNLQNIGREGTCPTCFQPLLDAYDRVLADLDAEMNALQHQALQHLEVAKNEVLEAGKHLKNQDLALEQAINALNDEQSRLLERARQLAKQEQEQQRISGEITKLQLFLREIGEVKFDEASYADLKKRLDTQEPRYQAFQNDLTYVSRELPLNAAALAQNQAQSAAARDALAQHASALAQTGYDDARYAAARSALEGFDEKITEQTQAKHSLEKRSLESEGECAQRREKLRANERILSQISEKLAEIELLDKLSKLLGQFKTGILERVSPGISQEASNLFSRITKGKYESIRVDENFEFFIADGGVFYPIKRFSGGEIDLANFCLRIAITKAIMELSGASRSIEFLAFDEIFGSQDEERRMEMMLALNYLQEQFRQIYIVSHIEALKDFFPHLLEVQQAAEGSVALWR